MSSSPHSRSLALACVGAITLALGSMYYAGKDSKKKEGPDSMFRNTENGPTRLQEGGQSDARLNSAGVREKMHELPRSGK
ncbi:hypothetical protein BV22DRAFT_195583 [Leucogyrophana mollusca]|uniref:Uncharacterized protein n=1 Tax=Leucogyrophana mollusca TaxID=85980 RepID=A0ACB8BTY8_9AGAM|nr:hypothetical protein BV22DRAFT_195583 [Leucogyrophana mollusca]